MGTLGKEMAKAGFQLSQEEEKKIKNRLTTMKKKFKKSICNKCGDEIKFISTEGGRPLPHNLDDVEHWQTCSYSSFAQKKASLDIMKKLAVLFIMKHGIDLEKEAGLSKKEAQMVQAILEKIFKEEEQKEKEASNLPLPMDEGEVDGPLTFNPEPCDSVGDPDEDRAPSEELIKEIEETAGPEKADVEDAIKKVVQS